MSLSSLARELSERDDPTDYMSLVEVLKGAELGDKFEPKSYHEGMIAGFVQGRCRSDSAEVRKGIEDGIFYKKQHGKRLWNKLYFGLSTAASAMAFALSCNGDFEFKKKYAYMAVAGAVYSGIANLQNNMTKGFRSKWLNAIHRNPEYFGENMMAAGVALTFASHFCSTGNYMASIPLAFSAFFYMRANHISIRNEEPQLHRQFPQYDEYKERVGRYFPKIRQLFSWHSQ